jgi:hypothetical protein
MCLTEWDVDASFHDFSNKEILASYGPDSNLTGFQHVIIDLASLGHEPKVFLTLTADCMNYFASGDWEIDNVNINGKLTLNTEKNVADIALYLSPNPVNNTLMVSGADHDFSYTIINTTGSKVLTGIGNQIDVSNLSKGLYYLVSVNQRLKFMKE